MCIFSFFHLARGESKCSETNEDAAKETSTGCKRESAPAK